MAVAKKKKTVIKRRPRRRRKSGSKLYFTKDTQAAIVKYVGITDTKEREELYKTEIMPAYNKLVENLINIYGFSGNCTYEELKNDCVTFLYEVMQKFDNSRGTNAFSYFNVVAKNWLIVKSKKRAKNSKRIVSLDDSTKLTTPEKQAIEEYKILSPQDEIMSKSELMRGIMKTLFEIKSRLKNQNELLCIASIITIFENIDDIDLLNKSAVLLYIKELSGLNQKQLTTTLHSIKKHYRELKKHEEFNFFI
tara:strand:- start:517 stop:1266 length:750 start_codon:yes stop_codon:yes gene_type:complete